MSRRSVVGAFVIATVAVCWVGCVERRGVPVSPCTSTMIVQEVSLTTIDQVDLLFMVDNSASMSEEQASLIEQLPRMVSILASGDFDQDGDRVGDGELNDPDFDPVRSLRIGIVTSDMGSGGYEVPTCDAPDFGDDGVLRTQGRTDMPGCMATYPAFLTFDRGSGASVDEFAHDVACVATAGLAGCGFEQQLESTLKALSPSAPTIWTGEGYVAPTFFRNTFGHGDGINDGFVRRDSVIALIPLTDEEDCSVLDPEFFNPSGISSSSEPNLRCFEHPEQLHPISRYVDGLLQLRAHPGLLIYAPIVGIPLDLVPGDGESPDWNVLVSDDPSQRDDRLEERVDPMMPSRLQASCAVPGRGVAFPPIRMLQVARQLDAVGAGVTVQSICQSSFEHALTQIIGLVRRSLRPSCLPRPLNLQPDGSVRCNVLAVMPDDRGCSALPGSEPRLQDGLPELRDGRSVCVMEQLVPTDRSPGAPEPEGAGWYYDTFTSEALGGCATQRIALTVQPPTGSILRLECFQSVDEGAPGDVTLSTFCEPQRDTVCAMGSSLGGAPLSCDPNTRTCGVSCASTADCRSAGLVGFVCDRRALSEVSPEHFAGVGDAYDFCVNPTCE